MIRTTKGFTLIELLVVIAIIGVLSSVVLTSLNGARNKATDSKIRAQLASARSQAEIYYDAQTPPSYLNFPSNMAVPALPCTGSMFDGATANNLENITGNASAWPSNITLSCQANGAGYAISAGPLSVPNTYWCVDSMGRATTTTSHQNLNDVTCI